MQNIWRTKPVGNAYKLQMYVRGGIIPWKHWSDVGYPVDGGDFSVPLFESRENAEKYIKKAMRETVENASMMDVRVRAMWKPVRLVSMIGY